MSVQMSKCLSIYTVASACVGGSGRKLFMCESLGYGGKGEGYGNILGCRFIIFISKRWVLTQCPASHPHPNASVKESEKHLEGAWWCFEEDYFPWCIL